MGYGILWATIYYELGYIMGYNIYGLRYIMDYSILWVTVT